jgi:hypothetical protein
MGYRNRPQWATEQNKHGSERPGKPQDARNDDTTHTEQKKRRGMNSGEVRSRVGTDKELGTDEKARGGMIEVVMRLGLRSYQLATRAE